VQLVDDRLWHDEADRITRQRSRARDLGILCNGSWSRFRSFASPCRHVAVRQAEIGQYMSVTNLLANGRLILKAVIQRPFAIGGQRPEDDSQSTISAPKAVNANNQPTIHGFQSP